MNQMNSAAVFLQFNEILYVCVYISVYMLHAIDIDRADNSVCVCVFEVSVP